MVNSDEPAAKVHHGQLPRRLDDANQALTISSSEREIVGLVSLFPDYLANECLTR